MENSEQPIHPHLVHTQSGEVQEYHKGLTKREYFSAIAMQGLMTSQNNDGEWRHDIVSCAEISIKMADELLKQLEKRNDSEALTK